MASVCVPIVSTILPLTNGTSHTSSLLRWISCPATKESVQLSKNLKKVQFYQRLKSKNNVFNGIFHDSLWSLRVFKAEEGYSCWDLLYLDEPKVSPKIEKTCKVVIPTLLCCERGNSAHNGGGKFKTYVLFWIFPLWISLFTR